MKNKISPKEKRLNKMWWLLSAPVIVLVLVSLLISPIATSATGITTLSDSGDQPPPRVTTQEPFPTPIIDEGAEIYYEIERTYEADYLDIATGDALLSESHGVYDWPFTFNSLGHAIHSYQYYGGTPYFHHGIDIMAPNGTPVFATSGGQIVNVENYRPGNDLYWEVAVLDPDGYIWQFHHIDVNTIPQFIWDKFDEYQADPLNGGFVNPGTHIGDIVYWTVVSFGKRFNHIHLNILGEGGAYVNPFAFFTPLADNDFPEILDVGLLQNGSIYSGDLISGDYSLYAQVRDLVLDDVYYLPVYEVTFSIDGGPTTTVWRFDNLPGGADDEAYATDYYVVPPTCGDYSCREFYVDLGFIPGSQRTFPNTDGAHSVLVTVRDFAGNTTSQTYNWSVNVPPTPTPPPPSIFFDDFETDLGWVTNPNGTDTATTGMWERGDPESTDSDGPKQLGTTVSGSYDLVTGAAAGSSVGTYDIDNGVTSVRSPAIPLPDSSDLGLSFSYYMAHTNNSSSDDFLRVWVVGDSTELLLEELGAANDDDAAWETFDASLNQFAGQTIYLLIEAADSASGSIVEAALDDVRIYGTQSSNNPPVADSQSVNTAEDSPKAITLTGSDLDGDPLTFSLTSAPGHGSLAGTLPDLVYTPDPDFNGADSFQFLVNDGTSNSDPATITISVAPVNDNPVANDQSASTDEDTPVAIPLDASDVDGDTLIFTITSGPVSGSLSGTAPSLTYSPHADTSGPDSFSYQVADGQGGSDTATVSITVNPVNDPPVAQDGSTTTDEDAPVSITLQASDIDSPSLTYTVVSGPSNGSLSGAAPDLTYTPDADTNGADSFTFIASDGQADSNIATFSITVAPVNDPPTANPQSVTTAEDTSTGITLTGSDVDGDALTFILVTQPFNGSLEGTAPDLTYTPNADFIGTDSFTFQVNDGQADSNTATVSIEVTEINDPPVANDDSVTTDEDTAVAIELTGTDPEGDPLSFSITSGPTNGSLSGTPPSVTYTPDADFFGTGQ